jgi:hypothetical protein
MCRGLIRKAGRRRTPSYSLKSASETKERKNLANAKSRIRDGAPPQFRWAETTTFVSRTALITFGATLSPIPLDLQVYRTRRCSVFPLRRPPNFLEHTRRAPEILQVFLYTHDDGLWFTTLINNESFIVLPDAFQYLTKLSASGQRRYNPQDPNCFRCFHPKALSLSPLN